MSDEPPRYFRRKIRSKCLDCGAPLFAAGRLCAKDRLRRRHVLYRARHPNRAPAWIRARINGSKTASPPPRPAHDGPPVAEVRPV